MNNRNEGEMRVSAQQGGPLVTIEDVWNKEPTQLEIDIREPEGAEGITLGFRTSMFTLKDRDGNGGEVLTSAGFGGESIILEWTDNGNPKKQAVIRGTELLIAWVETFDKEAAEAMRKSVK